ncbi:MAG: glycosyltransferase family 2 protein [Parcubacteria group bacterium]|nr:glycosyltransferase family 2 protein [Parcubacteria group bacterium]
MKNTVEPLKLRPSVSIAVIALNEAGNIENAIKNVIDATRKQDFLDFEILAINDGSSDDTGKIIDELAAQNRHIKAFHNSRPRGLGYDFRIAASLASKDYFGWFPGDNETLPGTITAILEQIGKADIIIPYTVNREVRSIYRRFLSTAFVTLFNVIFGLKIKYFNGPCFFKRDLLKTVEMTTDGPAYMAEILVQLVRRKDASYVEVPMYIKKRDYGASHVLKWKNVYLIGKTILGLIYRIYFR